MLYTVLQPPVTLHGEPAHAALPWYNSDSFDLIDVQVAPTKRSPLDMATSWASGATNGRQAMEALTRAFYERSGYDYQGDTGTNTFIPSWPSSRNRWRFSEVLDNHKRVECSDASNFVRAMAATLGLSSVGLRIEPVGSDALWTSYIQAIGPFESAMYAPPEFVRSVETDYSPEDPIFLTGPDEHGFVQIRWNMHETLEWEGCVFDPTLRLDSGPATTIPQKNLNPIFYYLNQRNLPESDWLRFVRTFDIVFGRQHRPRPLTGPNGFFAQTSPDYAQSFLARAEPVLGVTREQYRRRLLYLSDDSALRNRLGYGSSNVSFDVVQDLVLIR